MRFLCSHCEQVIERDTCRFNQAVACDHCHQETLIPASRFALGVVVDDFVIFEALGEGRICTRHLAHQLSLQREVVLQVLKRELNGSAAYVAQFVHEARCMARLLHPCIVHAYAMGEEDGVHFSAIEKVEGRDLESILMAEGRLPVAQACSLVADVADALDYAWNECRLLHRDIKPANILCTNGGRAKLIGFHHACKGDELPAHLASDTIVGSPPYLCPEALIGIPMDVRSDLYSLGATFYHLLTGRLPFVGASPEETAWLHLEQPVVPPHCHQPDLPAVVSLIVMRLMDKDIEARYESGAMVCRVLRQVLTTLPAQ